MVGIVFALFVASEHTSTSTSREKEIPVSFTIQRILGTAPAMVLGLLLFTPAPGLAQVLRPDLVVNSLKKPPETALPGDSFVATAGVLNQGAAAAGVSITRFDLVNTTGGAVKNLKGVQNVPGLALGASTVSPVTVEIYSDTIPGTYFLRACANGKDPKIPESNEGNNCRQTTQTIIVRNGPDLAVTAISDPPSPVPQGQRFAATYTVTNTGGEPAGASLVKFYLVPTVGAKVDLKTTPPEAVGALGPGATFTHTLDLILRPEHAPGTYRLQGCADSGKTVPEKDEDDNCKTSVGTVQVTPMPDLFLRMVTVTGAPLTVDQGASLAVRVIVRNIGLLNASASTLRLRLLSTDVTPQRSKGLKGLVAVPAVPVGERVILDATPIVDEETIPGSYIVQACADYATVDPDKNGNIPESDEKNNCATAPGTVTVTGVPLSPVDLAVTALTPPPTTRLPGETFPLTATVLNHGTEASPSTTTKFNLVNVDPLVILNKTKNLKGVQIVTPIAAGTSNATEVTVQVYPDTDPGTYFLQACADGEKQLREIDEGDNCFTTTAKITVLPVPDLVVTQVGNPPATVLPGAGFPVTETVQNIGPVGALASKVKFSLVPTVVGGLPFDLNGSQTVPALTSNAIFNGSGTVTVRTETLPGSYRLQACADAGPGVLAGDEDNDCALSTGVVQVGAIADLIVNPVKLPPAPVTVVRGHTVDLIAVVRNQGHGDAGASSLRFSLVISPGAAPIKKMPEIVPVLAVPHGTATQAAATVTIPPLTPIGTYHVQACVDIDNVVVESSNANNCGTSAATIQITQ
jgi:subtilase family serine protease